LQNNLLISQCLTESISETLELFIFYNISAEDVIFFLLKQNYKSPFLSLRLLWSGWQLTIKPSSCSCQV